MNKLIVLSAIAAMTQGAIAAETPDEYVERNGGLVQVRGKGWVAAVDCRPIPLASDVEEGVAKIKDSFNIDVKHTTGGAFSISDAASMVAKSGGNAAVFIIDDPAFPMALACAEEKWTMLNAAKAKVDSPNAEKLARRISMLFVRQCARVLGSDACDSTECCFYPVFSVEDLDAIESLDIQMGPYMAVGQCLSYVGIEAVDWGTYRDACEMGVAKPPTNDVQRAIWKEVHQLPTKPITIEPEKSTTK